MKRLLAVWIIVSGIGTAAAADKDKYVAVDLQPYATLRRFDSLDNGIEGNTLASVPAGGETFGGVVFNVEEKILHLGSTLVERYPEKVAGIKVDATCAKLHILHATCFGGGPNEAGSVGHVPDGTAIGQYMVRYSDGSGEGIPIVYGEDVRDWFFVDG